ncbi:MAG TPA: transketolase [Candidatus Saccharimonadales bacterium]|nr:transketolase [Candidatus Saccharimonadales bacterium]
MTTYNSKTRLEEMATRIRLDIMDMVEQAGSGHIDSSFSCVEIMATLYGNIMHHDPLNPDAPDRDRFILSKGHAAPTLYATLARHGYFDATEFSTLRRLNSRLQGHPKRGLPGIEVNTGSLGQGLSIASGLAVGLSRRATGTPSRVFALLSDGELNEGQVWEALMFAGHQHLGNLTAIVDGNGLQYSGKTHDVSNLSGFGTAVKALGWTYAEVDGHSPDELLKAFRRRHPNKPLLIFAHTTKGKGGLFLENDLVWHGKVPDSQRLATLRDHLQQQLAEISNA